ncbi:hypothetical protein F383_23985 [Gossypium arboreum]|uniref:Uncharacterized protein n=1 Tax=Gossypium arboreum TaxID=29729 RepID=A0A0B0P5Q2_GOSAR|nr:hypothetical protein F383_23985 [Gossypium arboreum]
MCAFWIYPGRAI